MNNVKYMCERCGMAIGRTGIQVAYIIKKYGGIFCRRCIKRWFNDNER